jgi:hypothetical protein
MFTTFFFCAIKYGGHNPVRKLRMSLLAHVSERAPHSTKGNTEMQLMLLSKFL